jgi:arginase
MTESRTSDIGLSRRRFLSATAASAVVASGGRFGKAPESVFIRKDVETLIDQSEVTEHTYHVLGVPLRTGSLFPGSENDAQAYRDVQLLRRLLAAGCHAIDEGDVAIPSYMSAHN